MVLSASQNAAMDALWNSVDIGNGPAADMFPMKR
jgi:hypothetical protein